MIPSMRRIRQALKESECISLLQQGQYGVLGLVDEESQPYAVPMNYAYEDHCLYFHCARQGYKLTLMDKNPRASFCVVSNHVLIPEEFTSYYRSVTAYGSIEVIENSQEKLMKLRRFTELLIPGNPEGREQEIQRCLAGVTMLKLQIDRLSGKQCKEYTLSTGTET